MKPTATRALKNKRISSPRAHRVATNYEEETYDDERLPLGRLLLSIFCGLLLMLPCIAITLKVVYQITENDIIWNLRGNDLAFFFGLGSILTLAFLLIPLARTLLTPVYVFGHELTHALFVFFCYGKVSAFKASADGGYIIANRANILVSLSPYIFPFWTLVLLLVHGILYTIMDLTSVLPYFFILYGATWLFNLFWTVWMIPLGQTDLTSNGTFFSLTLIYLANVLGLSILLELSQFTPSMSDWCFSLLNIHLDLIGQIY